jgi:hypothetical protein
MTTALLSYTTAGDTTGSSFRTSNRAASPSPQNSQIEGILSDLNISDGEVGKPLRQNGIDVEFADWCVGLRTDDQLKHGEHNPAAQACGTLAPEYWTGKLPGSRSMPE